MEKEFRQYDINFVGLKTGEHTFNYKIEQEFFKLFPESQFSKGVCGVILKFDKQAAHFVLDFNIEGNVEVECDRCTADLKYPIYTQFKLYVKFDDERNTGNEEENDEVLYIARTDSHINVVQFIYEYISLSIPMVRNCDFLEEKYKNCNQEILKKLNNAAEANKIDERWQSLKNIKIDK